MDAHGAGSPVKTDLTNITEQQWSPGTSILRSHLQFWSHPQEQHHFDHGGNEGS